MDLIKLNEPGLLFQFGQSMEDPRDGLTLFGPLDEGKPYGIRAGVIGTKAGIRRYKKWVEKIQGPISSSRGRTARPPFPGFEAAFRIPWRPQPPIAIEVPDVELKASLYLDDKYQRVFKTVEVFTKRIIDAIRQEDTKVDLWFVVIPDEVKRYCRPLSFVETALQIVSPSELPIAYAKIFQAAPSLFEEYNLASVPYGYEVNFHNQLKARLLKYDAPIQILQESTIAHQEFLNKFGAPRRKLDQLESAIAWNITTTAFYKAGGRPWKIGSIRDGVCYIGLVFKEDDKHLDPGSSCCAAQMFLDSGDGVIFKGAVGPWRRPGKGGFHLNKIAARELIQLALQSYTQKKGVAPKELFLHGKVRFNDEEWAGFESGVDSSTNLVGIRIRDTNEIKLFRKGKHPVLRGVAFVRDARTAFLWTKGYIPRLQTYPGREVPKPLLVDVCRGKVDIETVLNDIMALTKLNYNACIFADGEPVTLKFADSIGEILTAGPLGDIPPLPFRYYI